MAETETNASSYEAEHVHTVYNQIASHFSSTRYKPWPVVERFLQERPAGSIGIDAGCGNGKYLTVNRNVFIVASDRSDGLIEFARQHQPHSAIVADSLDLPHPRHSFDFAISIAVIHHLSTPARRVQAVEALLETLRPDGRALIFVWALEQKDSRRGWDTGHDQDVMVPWVMKIGQAKPQKGQKSKDAAPPRTSAGTAANGEVAQTSTPEDIPSGDRTFHRYYHLYKSGELEQDIVQAGGVVVESGYERDNWWAVLGRG